MMLQTHTIISLPWKQTESKCRIGLKGKLKKNDILSVISLPLIHIYGKVKIS